MAAPDEITQRHLNRLRVRGAPATIPDARGFVGAYEAEEIWRQTGRALVLPLERGFSLGDLRGAASRLEEAARAQRLTIAEDVLFALKGDPNEDPPHVWQFEAVLPVRGPAKAEADITLTRVQGGMHIATMTPRGLADLMNVYVYLFGKFLPGHKQQLMRPYILHRVIQGLEREDGPVAISVFVPAVLSIKPVPVPGEGPAQA